jgi:hypothetical protein
LETPQNQSEPVFCSTDHYDTIKQFVAPEIVESKIENRRKKRAFRSAVSLELDMEKHILRQMKGMDSGEQNDWQYL